MIHLHSLRHWCLAKMNLYRRHKEAKPQSELYTDKLSWGNFYLENFSVIISILEGGVLRNRELKKQTWVTFINWRIQWSIRYSYFFVPQWVNNSLNHLQSLFKKKNIIIIWLILLCLLLLLISKSYRQGYFKLNYILILTYYKTHSCCEIW